MWTIEGFSTVSVSMLFELMLDSESFTAFIADIFCDTRGILDIEKNSVVILSRSL